jgi:hypothetical protein
VEVLALAPLPPRERCVLDIESSTRLKSRLKTLSIFEVHGEDSQPGLVLVQEEGMLAKESVMRSLSTAAILQFWSLLSPEQKNAFIDDRAGELGLSVEGAEILGLVTHEKEEAPNGVFERFSGLFHAFDALRGQLHESLTAKPPNVRDAASRLFGPSLDSVLRLVRQAHVEEGRNEVERYVLAMCARQLVDELRHDFELPALWNEHHDQADALDAAIRVLCASREAIVSKGGDDMNRFVDWFDSWFCKRATPVSAEARR